MPTIRLASVDRDFPHTLRIHIVPERAVALADGQGASTAASSPRAAACSRVFDPTRGPAGAAAHLALHERPVPGGTLHNAPIQAALDALAARPSDFRAQVANVQLKPELGIVMRLNGGLDIILGPPLELRDKLRAAAWVLRHYPTRADRATLVYADVSAPFRPAVMPRGGYAETAGLGEEARRRPIRPTRARKPLRMARDAHAPG